MTSCRSCRIVWMVCSSLLACSAAYLRDVTSFLLRTDCRGACASQLHLSMFCSHRCIFHLARSIFARAAQHARAAMTRITLKSIAAAHFTSRMATRIYALACCRSGSARRHHLGIGAVSRQRHRASRFVASSKTRALVAPARRSQRIGA